MSAIGNMRVSLQCPTCVFCGVTGEVSVTLDQAIDYANGALAHDAFPDLSAEDRERIISGTCPGCWDAHIKSMAEEAMMDGGEE